MAKSKNENETIVVICPNCGSFREVQPEQAAVCSDNETHPPTLMGPADPDAS